MLRKQTAEQSDHDVDFEVKWAKKGIPRTWTYKTGQKVDGEWTTDHVRAGCIFIRTDDGYDAEFNKKFKYYGLDISKLCEQDQKVATKLLTGR